MSERSNEDEREGARSRKWISGMREAGMREESRGRGRERGRK